MRAVLATERGSELYRQRGQLIEPIFGHTKHNRGFIRFHRRGRAAARTEWRLIATTHNLRQAPPALHRRGHLTAPPPATRERPPRPTPERSAQRSPRQPPTDDHLTDPDGLARQPLRAKGAAARSTPTSAASRGQRGAVSARSW